MVRLGSQNGEGRDWRWVVRTVWSPVRDDGVPSRHNEEQVWTALAYRNKWAACCLPGTALKCFVCVNSFNLLNTPVRCGHGSHSILWVSEMMHRGPREFSSKWWQWEGFQQSWPADGRRACLLGEPTGRRSLRPSLLVSGLESQFSLVWK